MSNRYKAEFDEFLKLYLVKNRYYHYLKEYWERQSIFQKQNYIRHDPELWKYENFFLRINPVNWIYQGFSWNTDKPTGIQYSWGQLNDLWRERVINMKVK